MTETPCATVARCEYLAHALEVVGLPSGSFASGDLLLLDRPSRFSSDILQSAERGTFVVAVLPGESSCQQLGVRSSACVAAGPSDFSAVSIAGKPHKLRSWNMHLHFEGPGEAVLSNSDGRLTWLFIERGRGGVLLLGTDLIEDLLLYRQGDPQQALRRPQQAMWGIQGERPVYLFEAQLQGLAREDQRQADAWALYAAERIAHKTSVQLNEILPDGAVGAVVITGDDDQAYLEKYAEQLVLLQGEPITYFLHPQTRHTRRTMREMFNRKAVELGIHPDALEMPQYYRSVLADQCEWFKQLTGRAPTSLRNHGFLNDGYWGHLHAWREQGILISSNLPGLDGQPLNGSLLPGRILFEDQLTEHWSLVTAVGDGVRYVNGGRTDEEAARTIYDCADGIRRSGIPGVLVLNLHPQNVADTKAMHLAAVEVIRSGFLAWTMAECLAWFSEGRVVGVRERSKFEATADAVRGWLRRGARLWS